jgi:hypothetical protein
MIDVGAGRDFRNNAAIGRVVPHLRQDDVGQDFTRAIGGTARHRRGGFVTGGFDAENGGRGCVHQAGDVPSDWS